MRPESPTQAPRQARGCDPASLRVCDVANGKTVQLLLCQTKLQSTFRYLGVEAADALTSSERIEI